MSSMGKYCKAYLLKQLRQFPNWSENLENIRQEQLDGEIAHPRELTDDDVLYLQENYVVTDGIFKDEHIIFDHVTPEWQQFCHDVLHFEVPDYALIQP
jgi:hypothetical protein